MRNRRTAGRAGTPRPRRWAALACALACLGTVTAGCAAQSDGTEGADDPLANPWQEWIAADASCPATLPMSPDRYPQALRDQDGKTTWYGDDGLWVDLGAFFDAPRVGDSVRATHAWWTVDSSGKATLDGGPPTVRAIRLDGPGHRVATLSGHTDDSSASWSARLPLPANSCWLVTGERDGAVVRVVVAAR